MKQKRLTALLLALMMMVPVGVFNNLAKTAGFSGALALDSSNLTDETYAFTLRADYSSLSAPASAYTNDTLLNFSIQARGEKNSFAYAAINALDLAAEKNSSITSDFSLSHLNSALSNANSNTSGFARKDTDPGNRAMIAAYLARGKQGGPVIGHDAKRYPVSGISYIPDITTASKANNKSDYFKLIKTAVRDNGAVGISLYSDPKRFQNLTGDENFYDYPSTATADHTVVILGWDDNLVIPNYTITSGSGDSLNTAEFKDIPKGAFLVYDSLEGYYWVTYRTIEKCGKYAYYIDGFINTSAFNTLSDSSANPFGYTYEYDTYGQNSATGYGNGTAYFANVFTAATKASSLQAVSLFLTGEGNTYDIYYCADYTKPEDLAAACTPENKIASGYEAMPGYYNIPITAASRLLLPAQGKKFAIVAKVTCTTGTTPVPTYKSGTNGKGYISNDGSTWNDIYNAQNQVSICLKAHVEDGLTVNASGVNLPVTKDDDGVEKTKGGYKVLEVAPGKTYSIGPMFVPLNAGNVMPNETQWWMSDDIAAVGGGALEEISYDYDDADDLNSKKNPAKMGLSKYLPSEDDDDDEDSVPAPLTLNLNKDNQKNNVFSLTASSDQTYFNKEFYLKVKIYTGTKDSSDKWTMDTNTAEKPNYFETTIIVRIASVAVEKLELSKTDYTMKAAGTYTMKATITPSDASVKNPEWKVAKSFTYNKDTKTYDYVPFSRAYNAADPYNADGPIVTVSDTGKITAIKDGTCYVYAEVDQGEIIQSAPCKITVTQVAATGLSLNKKKFTMSTGTVLTLTATVKPTSASNKKVIWSVKSGSAVRIADPALGIIEALEPGVATVMAKTEKGGFSAECVITVSNAPSGICKLGKTSTFTLLGSGSKDTVNWTVEDMNVGDDGDDPDGTYSLSDSSDPLQSNFLSASQSSYKLKATANAVGRVRVTATITTINPEDEDGEPLTLRQQSWILESVIALSKIQLVNVPDDDEADEDASLTSLPAVKKLVLCVDPSPSSERNKSVTLRAIVVKPTDATLLDFEWTSKKPGVATVEVLGDVGTHNSYISITPVSEGSTKITGVNYNSNRKVSITVKVLKYPTTITTKHVGTAANPLVVPIGKNKTLSSKIIDKKSNKEVRYTLYNQETGAEIDPTDKDAIATVSSKGKLTAQKEGIVKLVAQGAPYDSTAPETEIIVSCAYPVRKVLLTGPRTAVVGEVVTITAATDPFNATNPELKFTGATLTKGEDGTYTFIPRAAGKIKITATSAENPKKSKTITIKIVEAAPAEPSS